MKPFSKGLLVAIGLGLSSSCVDLQRGRQTPLESMDAPEGVVVSGAVEDGMGRPIAGVNVEFFELRQNPRGTDHGYDRVRLGEAISDGAGRFSGKVATTRGEQLYLGFSKAGYIPTHGDQGRVPHGERAWTLFKPFNAENFERVVQEKGASRDSAITEILGTEQDAGTGSTVIDTLFYHEDLTRPVLVAATNHVSRRVSELARVVLKLVDGDARSLQKNYSLSQTEVEEMADSNPMVAINKVLTKCFKLDAQAPVTVTIQSALETKAAKNVLRCNRKRDKGYLIFWYGTTAFQLSMHLVEGKWRLVGIEEVVVI